MVNDNEVNLFNSKFSSLSKKELSEAKCPLCSLILFWPLGMLNPSYQITYANGLNFAPKCILNHYWAEYYKHNNYDLYWNIYEEFYYNSINHINYDVSINYEIKKSNIKKCKNSTVISEINLDYSLKWNFNDETKIVNKLNKLFLLI